MNNKKAMSALFKLVVVFGVVLILILSLVMLIIKLGKSGVDVLEQPGLGILFVLPVNKARQILAKFK